MSNALPVIVTGARGRIASAIARHFLSRGRSVIRFSRSAGDGCRLLDDLFEGGVLSEPHELYHCAWSSVPSTSEAHRGMEWREDLPLLWRLLDAIDAGGAAEHSRFHFMSSGGTIYGDAGARPNRETDPMHPLGWHGLAKAGAEQILEAFAKNSGLRVVLIRLSNPYGFRTPASKPQGVIPILIRAAIEQTDFRMWGDGSAGKDYLHVSDFLAALDAIAGSDMVGPVNVASGISVRMRDLISLVEQTTASKINVISEPGPPWDVTDSRLDVTRIREATGWSARVNLAEGVRKLADSMRDDLAMPWDGESWADSH